MCRCGGVAKLTPHDNQFPCWTVGVWRTDTSGVSDDGCQRPGGLADNGVQDSQGTEECPFASEPLGAVSSCTSSSAA
jgi:hypothetical protein